MKSNWQHQKDASIDQKNRRLDEHGTEDEKQKLHDQDDEGKQQALRKHTKDSEAE